VVSAGQVSREEVVAFLDGKPGNPRDLEPLSGGAWSSAWAYRTGGEELVVRFGPEASWYEADRMAMAFAGPDLPVPEVRDVGTTPSGRAYAISVRHHGRFLEDTPVEQAGAIAPALTRLLVALYRVPADPDAPVVWHQAGPPAGSWREFLLDGLPTTPGSWSTDGAPPWRPTRSWPPFPRRPPGGCGP
jgi:aminoglycoside phosphotransferase (APT) family kinase protein